MKKREFLIALLRNSLALSLCNFFLPNIPKKIERLAIKKKFKMIWLLNSNDY